MTTQHTRPELSFDGCGINGPDEYRTRLCTFTEKRGEIANHYGPLFAAAPDMLAAMEEAARIVCGPCHPDDLKDLSTIPGRFMAALNRAKSSIP